jgi:hypothetical protein
MPNLQTLAILKKIRGLATTTYYNIYIYIYIILPFRRLQLKGSNTIEKEL